MNDSAAFSLDQMLNDIIVQSLGSDAAIAERTTEETIADWIAFARKCSIVSGSSVVKFDPYPYQIDAFRQILENRGIVFGKERQMGLTEFVGNALLFLASDDPGFSAAIFSQTGDDTKKIAERVGLMAASNPDVLLDKQNQHEIKVKGGGTLLFRTSTGEGSRGLPSVNYLFFDEFAFVKEDSRIWAAALPSQNMVGDRARTIVVSTPPPPGTECEYNKLLFGDNGDRDVFRITRQMREEEIDPVQYWTDHSGWCKFFIHWKAHPVYSQRKNYLEEVQRKNKISNAVLQREYNLNLEAKSDDALIDVEWFPRFKGDAIPIDPWLILQSWDTAQTDNERSADWAGITILCWGNRIMIVDAIIKKYISRDGEQSIRRFAEKWKPHHVLIENKSSGIDIIKNLRDSSTFQFPVVKIEPPKGNKREGSPKVLRFEQEIGVIKDDHRVWLPERGSGQMWLTKAERSLENFPASKERDFPDALSQALHYIRTYERRINMSYRSSQDRFLNGQHLQNRRLYGIL